MKHAASKTQSKGQKRKRAAEGVQPDVDTVVLDAVPAAVEAQPAVETPAAAPPVAGPAYSLASSCTVKDAAALKQSLSSLIDTQAQVVIDASAVERVDTAIVQLLVAFVRDRLAADREVSWHAPSKALLEASRLLGVQDLLSLPRAEAA